MSRPSQVRLGLVGFTTCLLASASIGAETPEEAVRSMVAAEKRFYETGQEKGTRAAFLEFLAEDGIVFRPGPVNGKESWRKRPESGLDLVWEPTFAVMSRSADFGYDTGPAKWRTKKTDPAFTNYGHFISIWKKQNDGSWKVALDCGIENTKSDVKPPLRLMTPKKNSVAGTLETLQAAQSAFVATAKLDFAKAFRQFGSEEVRLYRNGSFPTVKKKDGLELLVPEAGVAMELMKTDMSSSADLAYSYGRCINTWPRPGAPEHFLQIWQTDDKGGWKLVLDWQQ